MKNIIIISLFIISLASSLYSQPANSGFAHPLQIEPVAVYTKLKGNVGYWHKDFNGVKEINKNINIEGEYKFTDSFSVISSIGRNDYSQTDTAKEVTWDRWNAGIKYVFQFR
ncbi:hypothetical protein [Leptospira vanthielii]|uniref:Outer membrane protein beta-barrel domain protein n=1 Tax=Leptospira vanthielii serovar Holland str. Waz Holland = ATCC 700522 TaxID=1218591 RepID=N1WEE9_9LEPT|nr:hypothetical protein [Leptospira vanthielii]EMY70271.1 hypothetical protein LEP1GSC199_3275 [Leptospira vanthielii serovar Holland str. Waz Holland = ATCC 700522]